MKKILLAAIILASFASCSKTEYTKPLDRADPAQKTATLTTELGTDQTGDPADCWKINIFLNQYIASGVTINTRVTWKDGLVSYYEDFTVVTTSSTNQVSYRTNKRASGITADNIYIISMSAEGYIF